MILISTDLPVPERPSTTTFSPWHTSRFTPCSTWLSPKDLYSSCIRITVSLQFAICIVLRTSEGVYDLNNQDLFNEDEEHGHNHGRVGGTAHALRTAGSMIALVGAYHANGKAKHQRPGDRRIEIEEADLLKSAMDEGGQAGLLLQVYVQERAHKPYKSREHHQQGNHEGRCQHTAHHQEFEWIDCGHFHGIDLLGHFHGAQFGANAGADLSSADDGRNQRRQRPHHGDGHKRWQPGGRTKLGKRRTRLLGEYQPRNEPRKYDQSQRAVADLIALLDDLVHLERTPESFLEKTPGKPGDLIDVGKKTVQFPRNEMPLAAWLFAHRRFAFNPCKNGTLFKAKLSPAGLVIQAYGP